MIIIIPIGIIYYYISTSSISRYICKARFSYCIKAEIKKYIDTNSTYTHIKEVYTSVIMLHVVPTCIL